MLPEIPKTLNLCGHTILVIEGDCQYDHGAPGEIHSADQTIHVEIRAHLEQRWENVWHEIVEFINYTFNMRLEHDLISMLGNALYQVWRSNFQEERDER